MDRTTAVRLTVSLSLAALTSACASGNFVSPSSAPPAQPRPVSAPSTRFVAPQVMRGGGVDSVIGQGANALLDRFGQARIDLVEGDARKLQFLSADCVLDVYLYPLRAGAPPVATHVEARARQGGGETDRAACIRQVERSR